MALTTTRLDSLSMLSAIFDRASFAANQGGWVAQASGATPEADTGPGSNTTTPYVYCNAAGAADEDAAQANSTLTLRQYLVDDWTGMDRRLNLTYCVTGAAFNTVTEGLEVETLHNGVWMHRVVIPGWDYSDTNVVGDTVTDAAGIDHTIDVDGNWVNLAFIIPDDAEGLRIYLELDDDTDIAKSNAALWSIRLDGGQQSSLRFVAEYRLLVDWDNDNTYSNAEADVWPRVIENTFQCRRGRNFASQRVGRSRAGSLEVQLDNRDGLFDPDNATSSLMGLLAGGRRVRWQVNDGNGVLVTQWTGWLDVIDQIDRHTGLDRVRLRALGVISKLNTDVAIDQQTAIQTGAAARLIFDPSSTRGTGDHVVDGVDYRANLVNGNVSMARWWGSRTRLLDLRDLEQTEGGFLWEHKEGFIALDAANRRQLASAQVSQATIVDESATGNEIPAVVQGVVPDHPLEDLANVITSDVRPYTVGAETVLWRVTALAIPQGNSRIIIQYPEGNLPAGNNVAVSAWAALTAGTDYTAQTGVTLTMTTEGNEATIAIANTGSATTMDIQVRGTPVVRSQPIRIVNRDQDSIDANGGEYPYPFATPWHSSIETIGVLHDILLRLYANPAERLTVTWEAGSDLAKATTLDLSNRLTVRRRGIETDYFCESIRHRITDVFHLITMTLSPAGVYGELFVIGQSRYGEGILNA